ncbi:MAG: glycosyltransferase [Chloroflexota bacterium]|nr:glycosyltransferase [Chloroflexota bacterium]
MNATYILPICRDRLEDLGTLPEYLRWLSHHIEVLVVDASAADVFAHHANAWDLQVIHLPPDPDLITPNGKVGNVLTGVRRAGHEYLILADDDIRYDLPALRRVVQELHRVQVVRPQNYFQPLPWHARWDTARSLLNRLWGGDWPGTLGVRRSILQATGGYDGAVLFENYELVQTVLAAGGHEAVPLDLYVRRLPPNARHFWSQRVRQAYDELCRPMRCVLSLLLLPLLLTLVLQRQWRVVAGGCGVSILAAEGGRRRGGGAAIFPPSASLLAPAWLMERAICIWLALACRFLLHGVRYGNSRLGKAATPRRVLRRRFSSSLPALPSIPLRVRYARRSCASPPILVKG